VILSPGVLALVRAGLGVAGIPPRTFHWVLRGLGLGLGGGGGVMAVVGSGSGIRAGRRAVVRWWSSSSGCVVVRM
jgi:ABC-type protease/lipase transport system fused ATPase/permease subunit